MAANDKSLAKSFRKLQGKKRDVVGFSLFLLITLPVVGLAVYLAFKLTRQIFCEEGAPDYAAIGELLLVIVIGVGEFVAFLELRYVAKDRDFHTWLKAQEVWTQEAFVNGRGKMFVRLDNLRAPWTPDEEKEGKNICRKMDEFAHLAPFLGLKKVLDVWDDPLAKAWIVLQEIVDKEREATKWPEKWKAFSTIGQMALDKVVREGRDPRRKLPVIPSASAQT